MFQDPKYNFMDNYDLVKAVTDVRLKSDVAGAGSLVGALSNRTNEENQKLYNRMIKTMVEKSNRTNEKLIFNNSPKEIVRRLIEMVGVEKKESYGIYANSDKIYKDCNGPDCKIIL